MLEASHLTKYQYLAEFFCVWKLEGLNPVIQWILSGLYQVVLPVLFVLLAMVFALIAPPFTEEPKLELHPWHYVPKKGEHNLYMFYR